MRIDARRQCKICIQATAGWGIRPPLPQHAPSEGNFLCVKAASTELRGQLYSAAWISVCCLAVTGIHDVWRCTYHSAARQSRWLHLLSGNPEHWIAAKLADVGPLDFCVCTSHQLDPSVITSSHKEGSKCMINPKLADLAEGDDSAIAPVQVVFCLQSAPCLLSLKQVNILRQVCPYSLEVEQTLCCFAALLPTFRVK
jgi:hypothetical protein